MPCSRRSLLVTALLFFCAQSAEAQLSAPSLRVMSYNIRYDNDRDGSNAWPYRRAALVAGIHTQRPDVLGAQEVLGAQYAYLGSSLPGYASVAQGRDGRAGGERCPIFWRKERFELMRSATFWLSLSPEKPSAAWGARLRRIVTWVELKDQSCGAPLFVFNTHFDHQSSMARAKSAELLVRKAKKIAGDAACVVMGDLNCGPKSAPWTTIVEGGFRDSRHWTRRFPAGPRGTFAGFGSHSRGGRIDFVFVGGPLKVEQHATLGDVLEGGRTPSDHRAVLADLRYGPADRSRLWLDEAWRARPEPKKKGLAKSWMKPSHRDSDWVFVSPGDPWESQTLSEVDGAVWFRKRVRIPESWKGRAPQLLIDGIADGFQLYLDGEMLIELGPNPTTWKSLVNLRLPRSQLKAGKEQLIALRVVDSGGLGGLVGRRFGLSVVETDATHHAIGFQERELLAKTGFQVNSEETRRLSFPIPAPADQRSPIDLVAVVEHPADDSGDRGLYYSLVDAKGDVIRSGFSSSRGSVSLRARMPVGAEWQLVIEDRDTRLGGRMPGNGGAVMVKGWVEDKQP